VHCYGDPGFPGRYVHVSGNDATTFDSKFGSDPESEFNQWITANFYESDTVLGQIQPGLMRPQGGEGVPFFVCNHAYNLYRKAVPDHLSG